MRFNYQNFNGRIGDSDIHGSLTYTTALRPKLSGDMESKQLRLWRTENRIKNWDILLQARAIENQAYVRRKSRGYGWFGHLSATGIQLYSILKQRLLLSFPEKRTIDSNLRAKS